MNTSLPKLQILLNDMLSNARAKRVQQILNLSFGKKNYITLLDVKKRFSEIWSERDLFTTIDELNEENASDFLMENAVFYFFMRTIQINDSDFFEFESDQLKKLIFETIDFIHSNELMDENHAKEHASSDKDASEKNNPEINAFCQLIDATIPKEEYFDYALGFYVASASEYMKKKEPILVSSF